MTDGLIYLISTVDMLAEAKIWISGLTDEAV